MPFLDLIYGAVWSAPLLFLVVLIGSYYTWLLKGIQIRYLKAALLLAFKKDQGQGAGSISHFQSLMTALAATIGIGNIAGVATAITVGGVGALFWMWLTALIGMAIKYAEAVLAIRYRQKDDQGEMVGGPMYFIEKGIGSKPLAISFALFGVIAAFGGGNMLQANAVAESLFSTFEVPKAFSALALAFITSLTLMGGVESIAKVASIAVPGMGLLYVLSGSLIIALNFEQVPNALLTMVQSAFTGQAALGGFAGSTLFLALRVGVSRGLMTSESGLGTASIAAAAARTDYPARQALVAMTGSFLSTIVMCTVTGLVLTVSGVFGSVDAQGILITGASLTSLAFQKSLPGGEYIVCVGILFFAFTTLIGWAYYGEKCLEYLLGTKALPLFRLFFSAVVIPGALLELETVWKISDIFNGLMAYPNLLALIRLGPIVKEETLRFLPILQKEKQAARYLSP
ncbi:MAG: agcs5 [Chlamydiales bacterium]|jgi:AGCS family alanine or glycine:cation symporter|nr:agcs5 [Chlamydiales bacterium]